MLGFEADFGRTARDYAAHRADFPESFYERLAALGIGKPGEHILDLATGTAVVARGMARRGAAVTTAEATITKSESRPTRP